MSNKDTVPLAHRWKSINWNRTHRKVRQIQTRIVKYLKQEKKKWFKCWYIRIFVSFSALCAGC